MTATAPESRRARVRHLAEADPVAALAPLARRDPARLAGRLVGPDLAVLARALGVRSTGRKADVARLIVERADLLCRLSLIGDEPARVARTFRRDSLLAYARALGCFTGLNKYGLAAAVLGRRDAILAAFGRELRDSGALD